LEDIDAGAAAVGVAALSDIVGMETAPMVAVAMVEETMIEVSVTMIREEGLEAEALATEDEVEALRVGGRGVR